MDRTKWMREMVKGGGRIGQDNRMREMVKGGGRIGQDRVDERNG